MMPTKDVSFSVIVRFLHKVGIDLKLINRKMHDFGTPFMYVLV